MHLLCADGVQGVSYGLSAGILLHVSLVTLMADGSAGHAHHHHHHSDHHAQLTPRHSAGGNHLTRQQPVAGEPLSDQRDCEAVLLSPAPCSTPHVRLKQEPHAPPAWALLVCLVSGAALMALLGIVA